MLDRILSALVALSLAFLVWLYARSRDQEILDNVPVPVHITLAPGQAEHYELEVTGSCQVPVSFTGPPSRIRELHNRLQRGELTVDVTLTVPEDQQGESTYLDTVHIEAPDIHAPRGVTPMVVDGRNSIPVIVHRLSERDVPVRLDSSLAERLGAVVINPSRVRVRGRQDFVDHAASILTASAALPISWELRSAAGGPVPVAQEIEGHPVQTTPAAVTIQLLLKRYELEVPIRFLCPDHFTLRPEFGDERAGKLTLHVRGPVLEEPPVVSAYIDLTRRAFQSGFQTEDVQIQLPRDFQFEQPPPRSVGFKLEPMKP